MKFRNTQRPLAQRPQGFTLIELLTVIAIIGILAAIVISTTSHVRLAGLQSKNVSQLRSIGQATLLFANDNRGKVPQYNLTPSTGLADNTIGNDASFRSPARALFPVDTPDMGRAHPLGGGDYLPDTSFFYSPMLSGITEVPRIKQFYTPQGASSPILGYYLISLPARESNGRAPIIYNGQLISNESLNAWGRSPIYCDLYSTAATTYGFRGTKTTVLHLDGSVSTRSKATVEGATSASQRYYYMATGAM